jgi:hypothetical protein
VSERSRKPLSKASRIVWVLVAAAALVGFMLGMAVGGQVWHLPPNWGDVPTWLAVIAAVAGGWIALSQLRSQQEVIQQAAEDARRAQAVRVFAGAPRDTVRLVSSYAKNASDYAVYEVQLWDFDEGELSELADLGTLLPGEALPGPQHYGTDKTLAQTVLTFRDANSVRWVRMPNGVIEQQSEATPRASILAVARAAGQPAIAEDSGTSS